VWKGVLSELYSLTKSGGVVVWVVGDSTVNGGETGTSFKQALYAIERGFSLHDTMIWEKPNPIPTQSTRYQQAFEYMFIFTKDKIATFNPIKIDSKCKGARVKKHRAKKDGHLYNNEGHYVVSDKKTKGNIWNIPNHKNKTAHKAIFPEKLANDHIISWSNEGDVVFDPFMGSGTTGKMAILNNRNFIGIELDKGYFDIAKERIESA
jgi:site-specific DNA-methyltransferase (adenine-specific)